MGIIASTWAKWMQSNFLRLTPLFLNDQCCRRFLDYPRPIVGLMPFYRKMPSMDLAQRTFVCHRSMAMRQMTYAMWVLSTLQCSMYQILIRCRRQFGMKPKGLWLVVSSIVHCVVWLLPTSVEWMTCLKIWKWQKRAKYNAPAEYLWHQCEMVAKKWLYRKCYRFERRHQN